MLGLREQVEPEHLLYYEFRGFALVCDGKGELQQVVLDRTGAARHVDYVIEAAASAQGGCDVFADSCARWVEDTDDAVTSESLGYRFYPVLDSG